MGKKYIYGRNYQDNELQKYDALKREALELNHGGTDTVVNVICSEPKIKYVPFLFYQVTITLEKKSDITKPIKESKIRNLLLKEGFEFRRKLF